MPIALHVRQSVPGRLPRAVKLADGLPVVTQDADFGQIAHACPALAVIRV